MSFEPRTIALANGLTLSCVEQGPISGRTVILLHGLTDSWRSYEEVLGHLPGSIRAVTPSLRGHGDSDKPRSGYRTEDFASDIRQLMDALELPAAVLAAHSSAAFPARRIAVDDPGRVSGLVLVGASATLRGNERADEFVSSTIAELRDPIDPGFAREFAEGTFTKPVSQAFLDAAVDEILKVPSRVWREAFPSLFQDDHTHELRAIAAPTLLVWGDQDSLIGRDKQDELLAGIPDAELLVYEGVGHSPHWEEPERFAADLEAFVERIESV